MGEYALESNVKIPATRQGRIGKYPFGEMEVNDSFEFDAADSARVRAAASHFGKRNGMTFSVRKVGDSTARCWRVG